MRDGEFGDGVFRNQFCAREGGRDNADRLDELDCNDTHDDTGGDCEPNIERISNDESVNESCRNCIGGDGEDAEFFDTDEFNNLEQEIK